MGNFPIPNDYLNLYRFFERLELGLNNKHSLRHVINIKKRILREDWAPHIKDERGELNDQNLNHLPCESCLFRLEFVDTEGSGSFGFGGGGRSGGGAGFPADCFDGAGGIADDGLTEYSLLPIEVRDAVLTTAAIEVAVIPLGTIHKWRHALEGGRGVLKNMM